MYKNFVSKGALSLNSLRNTDLDKLGTNKLQESENDKNQKTPRCGNDANYGCD